MENDKVVEIQPVAGGHDDSPVDMQPAGEQETFCGLSGLVVNHEAKKRFALNLLKSVTEDDLMTENDFSKHDEEITLPDLDSETSEQEQPSTSSRPVSEIVGTPAVEISDNLIDAVANKALQHYTTAQLNKTISTGRKQMDAVAEQYFNLYDELKRLRTLYLNFASQHCLLVQELNIRSTLQIEGKLPRPLTDDQIDLIRGMKVKVLRT